MWTLANKHQVTNNNGMLLEELKQHRNRPLWGTLLKENLRLTLKQILRKTLQQTSPNSKLKVVQEEFEVCGALRIITATTNFKSSSTPD